MLFRQITNSCKNKTELQLSKFANYPEYITCSTWQWAENIQLNKTEVPYAKLCYKHPIQTIYTIVHHWMKPQKFHTTAHMAQKLAITQYCKQDQSLPVKTEMTFSMNPSWLVWGNTDKYLSSKLFSSKKGRSFFISDKWQYSSIKT